MSLVRLLPLKKGERVRVIAECAPECRERTIVEVHPGRGYRVHHDEPAFMEPVTCASKELDELLGGRSPFAGKQDFNWTAHEVVRLETT